MSIFSTLVKDSKDGLAYLHRIVKLLEDIKKLLEQERGK